MEFRIMKRVQPVGNRKGQEVYYALPKDSHEMSHEEVVNLIVRRTSLTAGDVSNAIISLAEIVREALSQGWSVDLAELGRFRVNVSSKMMDSADEVTVANTLNRPKVVFHPKRSMQQAAKRVQLHIDRSTAPE